VSQCTKVGPFPVSANFAPYLTDIDGSQLINISATLTQSVICPIELTGVPGSPTVGLDGWKNGANGITAKGCYTFPSGGGGVCTPSDPNTNPGIQHVTVPNSAWQTAAYNYLLVTMAPCNGSNCNTFFGYSYNP
jgi:hypothetical protein